MMEILVTLFIVAIGVLGMAALQFVSLKNANSSNFRYQATLLIYDMAERMRANKTVAAAGGYHGIDVDGSESACSSCTIAQTDEYEWSQQVKTIPGGRGRVTLSGGLYTIRLDWKEQETGADLGSSTAAAEDKSFSMVYQP